MIMIKLGMFSYNFAYTIMSDILYQKNQNKASIQRKTCYLLTSKENCKSLFISLRCQTRRIWLAHLLVEIPRGFELRRNWSIQLR